MTIDHELTRRIQAWVESPAGERDTATGALFLLQLTRNHWLYKVACLYPQRYASIVDAELRKHLRIRLAGLTAEQVAEQEPATLEAAAETLSTHTDKYKGKRPDHDQLPERIRRLYERNGEIYEKMKAAFNAIQELEKGTPCDRYEHVQILRDLDDRYRANWETYDNYDAASDHRAEEIEALKEDAGAAARTIAADRRSISERLKRLEEEQLPDAKREKIADQLQERVDRVRQLGGTFSDKQTERLEAVGISTQ